MRTRRLTSIAAALAVILLTVGAAADPLPPVEHIKTPSHLVSDGGTDLRLPPGYFVPDPMFIAIDVEMKRLQDAETRLGAENKSLRASASEGPGWGTLAWLGSSLAAGFAAGALLH